MTIFIFDFTRDYLKPKTTYYTYFHNISLIPALMKVYTQKFNKLSLYVVTETDQNISKLYIYTAEFYYNNNNYLTIVDAFSKFAQAIPIKRKTAINICDSLTKFFASFGILQKINLDS